MPFQWSNLTAAEQSALDTGDSTNPTPPPYNYSRLNYLRGDRSNEQTPTSSTTFIGTFRARASVLGDIIDSSPTWVGPPTISYPNIWADLYDTTGDVMSENSGQTYAAFASSTGYQNRTNVVYSGANDGMLHAFRSGYFSAPNTYQPATNDGQEMMAYVPGYIVNTIQSSTASHNYSDPQYGHHFNVDATPGTGDVFYGGLWHTWLIGGLGPGGSAIYALDITDPGMSGGISFSEGSAASTVIGEWSYLNGTTNLHCVTDGATPCGVNLGQTYGVPQIRRFHNGMWGAVFGNGYKSKNGDGGIYVMLVNPTSGAISFYYLSTSTGSTTTPNGIYYTAPTDLDGDNITDYVYAGDLLGHVWRFDLTSTNPAKWGVTNSAGTSVAAAGGSPQPIFTTSSGQPITTQVVAIAVATPGNPRMMIEFGTGQQIPLNNFSSPQYSTSQQALYGIWDWNYGNWNTNSSTQYASLPSGLISAPSSALSGTGSLQQQTIGGPYAATVAGTGSDYRTLSNNAICWADTTGCNQYGWYINLVSGNAYAPDPAVPQTGNASYANAPVVWEQIIFNPTYGLGAFVVNTTIPPATAATMCYSSAASGWTMAINPATGGEFAQSFFVAPSTYTFLNVNANSTNLPVSGLALGGTGSTSTVQSAGGQWYLLTQTVNNSGGGGASGSCTGTNCSNPPPGLPPVHPPGNYTGSRVTWTERR